MVPIEKGMNKVKMILNRDYYKIKAEKRKRSVSKEKKGIKRR